jgi:hypothetical protein
VIPVKLDLKYFAIATLLTLALILVDYRIWYIYAGVPPTYFATYFFPLAQLVIAVVLPFAIMYLISTRIQSWTNLWSILISTFLGCLLGGLIHIFFDWVPGLLLNVNYGYLGLLLILYEVSVSIAQTVFSEILFVSIAAILFAYYRTHPDRTIPQPAQVTPSI